MKLRSVLQEVNRREEVQNNKEYNILGVRWYAKGLFVKSIKKGSEIQAKYIYKISKGDFVYNRLFAWKGSFAIATDDFDDCYVSNEFPCFCVDENQLNVEYLMWNFSQPYVWDNCLEKSEGSTAISRNRFKVEKFLDITIKLPSLENQQKSVYRLQFVNQKSIEILGIKEDSMKQIINLRHSILQEAVQGKLITQDPTDEPANVLLEEIKVEKERLIKDKKIKREKPMPEITVDEIPYELPQGWEWVRLGNICNYIQRGKSPEYSDRQEIPVISQKCVQWNGFDITKARYINPDTLDKYEEIRWIQAGDLLWNSTGLGTLGRINVYPNDIGLSTVVADSHVTVIRPTSNLISSEYLYYWFSGPTVQGEINDKSSGSTKQTELNTTTIVCYLVPLPPIKEQKRIVEKVDQLMTLFDELEKTVEQSKEESEMLMQSVVEETFNKPRKVCNIVKFPISISDDAEAEWDMIARAEGISPETQAEIADTLDEIKKDKR